MPDTSTPGLDDVFSDQLEDHLSSLRPSMTPSFAALQQRKRTHDRGRRSGAAITLAVVGVAGVALLTSTGAGFGARPSSISPAQSSTAEPSPRADPIDPTNPRYRINASGLTYGSSADAVSPGTEPDLIAVAFANGGTKYGTGYVRRTDLADATGETASKSFKSPDDAMKWQASPDRLADKHVTVFENDGTTIIGTFLVAGSVTQAKEAKELAERIKRDRPAATATPSVSP